MAVRSGLPPTTIADTKRRRFGSLIVLRTALKVARSGQAGISYRSPRKHGRIVSTHDVLSENHFLFQMAVFADLPPEIIQDILVELEPIDVSSVSRTSRTLYDLIYDPENHILWRKLYLAHDVDDLRFCVNRLGSPVTSSDWRIGLQRIIRAETVAQNDRAVFSRDAKLATVKTLLDMADNVVPIPGPNSVNVSHNHAWLVVLLRCSNFLDQDRSDSSSLEERQMRARLHCSLGLIKADLCAERHVESRSFVYAMRNYREQNYYGPFMMDGSGKVNWEHMLAIHHVMSMHIAPQYHGIHFRPPIYELSMPFCQPMIPGDLNLDTERDWAGVEGVWKCSFCFCDHRDLLGKLAYLVSLSRSSPLWYSLQQL